jgi:alpha-maltose-1-phosphate synthase
MDPQALARAICEVLADSERAGRMGEAGRKRAVEMFSWEGTTNLLLQHYNALLR